MPFVTCSTAPNEPSVSVSTIVPSLVKPFNAVRFAVPRELSPTSRSVAAPALVTESLNAPVPWTSSAPWFTSRELIVLDFMLSRVAAATVNLPLPPQIAVVSVSPVVAVLKSCDAATVAPEIASVPLPPMLPPL